MYGAAVAAEVSQPFWDGLAEGRLRLQRCSACGLHQTFPQLHCRRCLSRDLAWVDAAGTGTLISYSTVHRAPSPEFADKIPYVLGIVRLDEGVQMVALLGVDHEDELELDLPVRATVDEQHGTQPLVAFVPAETAA